MYFLSGLLGCAGLSASTTAIDHYHYVASVQGSHTHTCWHPIIQEFVILAVTICWNLLSNFNIHFDWWSDADRKFRTNICLALLWHCRL